MRPLTESGGGRVRREGGGGRGGGQGFFATASLNWASTREAFYRIAMWQKRPRRGDAQRRRVGRHELCRKATETTRSKEGGGSILLGEGHAWKCGWPRAWLLPVVYARARARSRTTEVCIKMSVTVVWKRCVGARSATTGVLGHSNVSEMGVRAWAPQDRDNTRIRTFDTFATKIARRAQTRTHLRSDPFGSNPSTHTHTSFRYDMLQPLVVILHVHREALDESFQ